MLSVGGDKLVYGRCVSQTAPNKSSPSVTSTPGCGREHGQVPVAAGETTELDGTANPHLTARLQNSRTNHR